MRMPLARPHRPATGASGGLPMALAPACTVRLQPEHEAQAVRALGAMLARLDAGAWGEDGPP